MKLDKKKKKIIGFTSLGVVGLAILTIPTVALVGCATSSSPYGPYSNFQVTLPTGAKMLMSYDTNNASQMSVLASTGGLEIPSTIIQALDSNGMITGSTIGGWFSSGNSSTAVPYQMTPSHTTKVTVGKKSAEINTQSLINYYNQIELSTTVTTTIVSWVKQLVTFATQAQPFGFNPLKSTGASKWTGIQASQWNAKIGSNEAARAFTDALVSQAGVGQGGYALWPSVISFQWKIVKATDNELIKLPNFSTTNSGTTNSSNPTTKTTTSANSPLGIANAGGAFDIGKQDTLNYTMEVSNINVYYSWFQKQKTGGIWATNISQVDNAMTTQQKQILANVLGTGASTAVYKNLTYKVALGNLDFNVNPGYLTYTPPNNSKSNNNSSNSGGSNGKGALALDTTSGSTSGKSASAPQPIDYYNGIASIGVPNVPPSMNQTSSSQTTKSSTTSKSSTKSSSNSTTKTKDSTPVFVGLQNASYFTLANSNSQPLFNLQNFYSLAQLMGVSFTEGAKNENAVVDKPIYNNVDMAPFLSYKILWLMGALSTGISSSGTTSPNLSTPSLAEIEKSSAYTTMMSDQKAINQMLLSGKASAKLASYLTDANYIQGVNDFYQAIQISGMGGSNQFVQPINAKGANGVWAPTKTATTSKTTDDQTGK